MNFWKRLRRIGSLVFIVLGLCVLMLALLKGPKGPQADGEPDPAAPRTRPVPGGPSGL